jgi:hypothetical protein
MKDRQIYAIRVDQLSGELLLGMTRDEQWGVEPITSENNKARRPNNLVSKKIPISKGENHLGTVQLSISTRFVEADLKRSIIKTAALLLVLNLILVLALALRDSEKNKSTNIAQDFGSSSRRAKGCILDVFGL